MLPLLYPFLPLCQSHCYPCPSLQNPEKLPVDFPASLLTVVSFQSYLALCFLHMLYLSHGSAGARKTTGGPSQPHPDHVTGAANADCKVDV